MIENETIFQKLPLSSIWDCTNSLAFPNRGMSFGDGLFETMVWDRSHIRFFDKHIQRLKAGMSLLGLDVESIDADELVSVLADKYSGERKRLRWNVFRAGVGKYTPETSEVFQTLQISKFSPAISIKSTVDISLKIQLFPTVWSSFKTINALPYVLANQERKERGLDEIIMLDHRGFISESGASNIFWTKGKVVYTPSLSCSCINGVSRQVILSFLKRNKLLFQEGEFTMSELDDADQVFVSNCTGISYLGGYKQKKYSTEPLNYLSDIFE